MMRKGETDGGGGEEERGKNCLQAVFLTFPLLPPPAWLYCLHVLYETTNTPKHKKKASYPGKIVSDPYVYNNKIEGKPKNRP